MFSVTYHLNDTLELTFRQNERSFKALQLHFHWAPVAFEQFNEKFSTKGGSEHTLDSNHYPIEVGFSVEGCICALMRNDCLTMCVNDKLLFEEVF